MWSGIAWVLIYLFIGWLLLGLILFAIVWVQMFWQGVIKGKRLFISYRREDSAVAGRISDRLEREFIFKKIFMDVLARTRARAKARERFASSATSATTYSSALSPWSSTRCARNATTCSRKSMARSTTGSSTRRARNSKPHSSHATAKSPSLKPSFTNARDLLAVWLQCSAPRR